MTITESARIRLRRPRILVGIDGQSNEQGTVPTSDRASYPLAFQSARNPAVGTPFPLMVARGGGWWSRVYDELYDWGYDLQFINGGVGSQNFTNEASNYLQTRNNSSANYYQKRNPSGVIGDRGDQGSFILVGTRVFQCTVGNTRSFLNEGQMLTAQNLGIYAEIKTSGTATSAASPPAGLSTANVGDTVVDGGITWTCVATDLAGTYAATIGPTNVLAPVHMGYGFDPLGIMQRLNYACLAETNISRKIIYIQNAQANLFSSATGYSNTLISKATYYLLRDFEVMIGLSCFSPAASGATTTNYDTLTTAVGTAIASLQASYPGKVWAGANLYTAMGSTGPMASGGAFLQPDNIHLNGAGCVGAPVSGVSAAYKHVSDSFKAVLPKLVA